ncbi:alpha/beta fold hydrolase [Marinoscillum pacificum]|uniref:alpha/beta fold hydrolase n=1 Tax=Marinoscillum pacificum TaxID=392723 RepID=UPI002157F05C|nr:alpha/beta hydrolase [Marinoscillum pacificum]
MKNLIFLSIILVACSSTETNQTAVSKNSYSTAFSSGYSEVNELSMYYEIHGTGDPIVLIHGGGSTIETNWSQIIPILATNRKVIAMELQAHGRTDDRGTDTSFEQDADDISILLANLAIEKADILGFSNGATTALLLSFRHPNQVNKLIAVSPLAKRNGVPDFFWDFMKSANLENMPKPLQVGFLKVTPDSTRLQIMHDRDAKRMVNFEDIPNTLLQSIKAPTLLVVGDKDVILPTHILEMHQLLPNSEMAVLPGTHGECIGEITTLNPDYKQQYILELFEEFLNK